MPLTALPQLQEIESDLAAQEDLLIAHLDEVKAKLKSVRAVMPLFERASSSESPAEERVAPIPPVAAKPANAVARPDAEVPAAKQPAKEATEAKREKSTAKKKDGRAAIWQKYTRPGVKNESIPDAVKLILETQPNKNFKIAEVMAALFTEEIPKAQYLKARNRISNVLSGGVRAGDWYRGERSTYCLTAV